MRHKITVMATLLAASLGTTAQELRTTYFMQTSDLRHEMNPALLDHSYVSFPFLGNMNIARQAISGPRHSSSTWNPLGRTTE